MNADTFNTAGRTAYRVDHQIIYFVTVAVQLITAIILRHRNGEKLQNMSRTHAIHSFTTRP